MLFNTKNKAYKENNMIKYLETKDLKNADDFRKLYLESFIENERVDFDKLFSGVFGDFKLVGQYDNDKFVGMMHYVVKENFLHLNYFAIVPDCQNQGYGTKFLSWLKDTYPNTPIVVDVEEQDDTSDNADYRILRKKFYQKNGFKDGKYSYHWNGVYMTYFSTQDIDADEFMKYITWIFPTIKDIEKK